MTTAVAPLDVRTLREEFPIFGTMAHGRPLVYLDSAATSQKPRSVIRRITRYYERENANIHRGVYALSADATAEYDRVRAQVARFLGAAPDEIVFTRGTTEAINLVAASWGGAFLGPGDEIVVTAMEHHSNLVPWQLAAERTGAVLRVAPVTDAGELDLDAFAALLNERTRLVAAVHVSNALGTINPVRRIADLAHAAGAVVLVDGAQSAPHLAVDVAALGCDFFAFSGHKLYGPTGIGALYGRRALLERMPPWQGGGDMIERVEYERSTWAPVPQKFEAGTPHIAGVAGLGAALEFVERTGLDAMAAHEHELLAYATERVREVPGLRVIGTAPMKAAVLAFTLEGAHPHDVGTILDREGIAIRAGHHCCQPLMRRMGVAATARASFAAYNTRDEADALVAGLREVRKVLRL
jgi:cysteine desulfurase/selenocysteine lyase